MSMTQAHMTKREWYTEFFNRVNAEDSIPGGIIHAKRPNDTSNWDAAKETQCVEENTASFVQDYKEAVKLLAKRK